jgi:omega-amidase
MHVVGGFIEAVDSLKPRNTTVVYSPEGVLLGSYSKNHLFTYGGEDRAYSPGDGIAALDFLGFRVSPLICYDLRFPETFRKATSLGTTCFVVTANWPNPRLDEWIVLARARAIENQACLIAVNQAGETPKNTFFGSSMIVGPKGEIISQAGADEQIISADLDPTSIMEYRRRFPVLDDILY